MATLTARRVQPRRLLPAWLWPAAADQGIEHINLVRTGLGLVFFYLALVFLPGSAYSYARFIVHPLGLLWVGMAITKMTRPMRFAFPFVLLLLLQVWMVVSMLSAEQSIAKPLTTGGYLWYPLEIGMVYLVTLALGTLMPGALRYVINWLLVICTASAAVAILQAAHFGPAIKLADFYVYRSIEGWDNVPGVRASGLTTNGNVNLMALLGAACFIAYKSTRRRLHWYDYTMWGLFIAASFMAQHRSSMPLVALTFVVTAFILFRKRPSALVTVFTVCLFLFAMAATAFKHNFAYTFETAWSSSTSELKYRLDQEAQAYTYFKLYPLTGIGPSPAPESVGPATGEFDFKVENLYYAILLTLGVPGIILVLTMYGGSFAIAAAYSLNRRLPHETRILMVVCALGAFNLLWNGNVAVNLTQFGIMAPYMVLLVVGQLALARRTEPGRKRVSAYLQGREPSANQLVRF
jgi:hypothetical protein